MFTGIIETLGTVVETRPEGGNLHLVMESDIGPELTIDQSLCHNGVCLTVVAAEGRQYTVTAVAETLKRTNLGDLRPGDKVNLERAMVLGARLDGHIVQGHVDLKGEVTAVDETDGSWEFRFEHPEDSDCVTIEKGSITVDGVSLTAVDSQPGGFSVAIIPYTYAHTRFREYAVGTPVNLEFDVIGKYVARLTRPIVP